MKRCVVFFLTLLISLAHCGAEQRHLESTHFLVSYPAEIEDTARHALEIAEETAETLAPYFGYRFAGKKIVINVCDESDFSNGFARRMQRYVGIDIRKTEIPWRGDTPWLRNVIAHELSHKYTLDTVKRPIYVYASGDVWIDDEGIEGGGSSFLEHNRLPNWFVEALAQFGSYKFGGDRPDPYREMLLRDAFLHGHLLSLDDMARYERSSRDGELVYNQGFHFFLFLMDHEPRQQMSQFLVRVRNYGLEKTVKNVYGMSLEELYSEWVASLGIRFSGFSKGRGALETLYPEKRYPFVGEIACTDDGRYVIANWGNDYADYSLFEKKNRSYRRLADDVGAIVKRDPVSGDLWFNRLVYDAKNDWEHFELFRSVDSGRPKQVLEGTRTRAFDVHDDTLVFASYQAGITRIEQYNLDSGQGQVLRELPPGTAVYSISLIEGPDILVTVGDGQRIRLFRSTRGEPVELWPEIGADILDAVHVGDGRVLFSSTLDGTPQLYAAELDGKVEDWHKLTEVPGGAFRPVVTETNSGKMTIACSVYEDGSFKLKRFTVDVQPEATIDSGPTAIVGRSTAFPEYQDTSTLIAGPDSQNSWGENLNVWERSGISPLVPAYPIWTLYYGIDDDEFDFERTYIHTLSVGTILYFSNASDTLDLEIQGGLDLRIGEEDFNNLNPFFGLEVGAELFRGALYQELDYWTYSYFAGQIADEYWINKLAMLRTGTVYEFPLARYCDLAFGYSYYHQNAKQMYNIKGSGMSSVEVYNESVFGQHEASLQLSRSKWDSVYEPANLGRPGSLLQFSVTGILNRYYDLDWFYYVDPKYDPSTALELAARIMGRVLSPKRRVSLTGQLRGRGYLQTEYPEVPRVDIPPYIYLSLGKPGYATGYDYFYPAVYFAQGELDLRVNPFHNPFDRVRWYERFSFGVRAEGGIVFTLDSGELQMGYPLSLELALRGGILITPKREAYLYCKGAVPLTDLDFFGTEWPYRIYFGFSL